MSTELAPVTHVSDNLSTVSTSDDATKLQVVAAINSASSLNDWLAENGPDAVLDVVQIFSTPGVRKARGAGQTDTPCNNTYLITADGECLMSQSVGVYRSAAVIVQTFPTLDLGGEHGIRLRVRTTALKNGNSLKTLVPVL